MLTVRSCTCFYRLFLPTPFCPASPEHRLELAKVAAELLGDGDAHRPEQAELLQHQFMHFLVTATRTRCIDLSSR